MPRRFLAGESPGGDRGRMLRPMHLTIHTRDTVPEGSRALYDGIAGDLGFVPNLAAAIAESPVLLAGFDGLRRAVGAGGLDPVLRETAGLAVGVAVDNHYGVAFHSTVLGGLGVADDEIDRMRSGQAPGDEAGAAVYELARSLVLDRGKLDAAAMDRARAAALTTGCILEVVAECAFASLVGLVVNLAGGVELDAFLAPRAWA
jgi:alkylhydroperoxidase family enzyme